MRTIRTNVFETNSSSTHAICITDPETFEAYKKGDYAFTSWGDKLLSAEELFEKFTSTEYSNWDDYLTWCEEHKKEAMNLEDFKKILHILAEDDWDKKTEESDYVADWLRDNSYQMYNCLGFDEYETFEEFKTINGTEVVAFGYYGGC
jgi:hypothetical protein